MGEAILFSHPNCYAKCLGDCSEKISKEHYISENILKTFKKIIPVEGFNKSKKMHDGTFSLSSFSARVLCKKHNESLNDLDTEAGKLFDYLRCVGSFEECEDHLNAKGLIIERWFLKYLLGAYSTGQFSPAKIQPSHFEYLVKILFGKGEWLNGHGLFINKPPDSICYGYHQFGSEQLYGPNNEILGIYFSFAGFPFYLAITVPEDLTNLAYRPKCLKIDNDKQKKTVELDWNNDFYKGVINLTFLEMAPGPPPKRSFHEQV
jgi:hypothetical protein